MNIKLQRLNNLYAQDVKACMDREGEEFDDRTLFINMVQNLTQAVLEFERKGIDSTIIKIAFNKEYQEQIRQIDELSKSLKDRGMI